MHLPVGDGPGRWGRRVRDGFRYRIERWRCASPQFVDASLAPEESTEGGAHVMLSDEERLGLLEEGIGHLKRTKEGYDEFLSTGRGSEWRAALKSLDKLAADLAVTHEEARLQATHEHLGPVLAGHKGVCDNDLTHATDGFPWHPAYDDFADPGTPVLAPEDLVITKWGSAQGGESVHADGVSGIHWWFGHVDKRRPVGTKIKKGQRFASVSAEHREPHVHVGVDARAVIGHELEHHTNYTHGAPKVCAQLTAGLAAQAAANGDPSSAASGDGDLARRIDHFIDEGTWKIRGDARYSDSCPLEGFGETFVRAGRKHGVDPRFLVAIATHENRLGTYKAIQSRHNTFGLGPGRSYKSWEANIEAAARNLSRANGFYVGKNTIKSIGSTWAPVGAGNDPEDLNQSWIGSVTQFYAKLGGRRNQDAVVKTKP
jgi:hypothetical protein